MDLSAKIINNFQSERNLTVNSVESYLKNLTVTKNDLTQYLVAPRHFEYDRYTLFKNENIEVCVLNWVKGSKSTLHDHANSDCTMLVVQGQLLNKNYRLDDANQLVSQIHFIHEEDVVSISKSDIHQLEQTGDENAITLHAYYPPIEYNNTFENVEDFARVKSN
jgi:predicted metal-dependent enzyme (double-stranded beta helix superfamily)